MFVYQLTDCNFEWTAEDNQPWVYFGGTAELCSAIAIRLRDYCCGAVENYLSAVLVTKIELSANCSPDQLAVNLLNQVRFAATHEDVTTQIVDLVRQYRKASGARLDKHSFIDEDNYV